MTPGPSQKRHGGASAVRLTRATLALGERAVLTDVSIDIAGGEFIAVLGPNGAGKTTLFRALLGLVPVTSGDIAVLGRPVRRGNPRIGYMPQSRRLPWTPRLNGAEFVANAAGGGRWGWPWPSRADRAETAWALSMVDSEDLAKRPIGELSGGERQRLLLAQALLGRPELLLLDEPLASLDPGHQQSVVALIDRVRRALGVAVLFSAHDINPLLAVVDRVLYLGGRKAALGTVDAVITGPVLSRLYDAPIEVTRAGGRLFVTSGAAAVGGDDDACSHDHGPALPESGARARA